MPIETESLLRDALPRGAEPALDLALFGKHHAWDDHMEHLGAETSSILTFKQSLYVQGIGDALSRGIWMPLEQEGSALPFAHDLIWSRGECAVFAVLSPSTDSKGRDLYPLVAACQARGYPLDAISGPLLEELKSSLSRLQATQSRETARRLAQGLQGRLRSRTFTEIRLPLQRAEREAFLNSEEMGPDRQGFRRILHVVLAATEYGTKDARLHLRVPLCHTRDETAYTLWRTFLQMIFGTETLLLLARQRSTSFIDIIVGAPRSDDFFCLRAGESTIALTHKAPYSISEATQARADDLFERFLAGEAPPQPAKDSTWSRFLKRLRPDSQ